MGTNIYLRKKDHVSFTLFRTGGRGEEERNKDENFSHQSLLSEIAKPTIIAPEAKSDTGVKRRSRESKERLMLSKGVSLGCFGFCVPPFSVLTCLSLGNETVLVCKLSPGSGARLCVINKSSCRSPQLASPRPDCQGNLALGQQGPFSTTSGH